MNNFFKKATFLAVFLFGVLFFVSANASETGVVSLSSGSLNVRSGAGTTFSKVATISNGASVAILSNEGEWLYIQTGNVTGYVLAQYIKKSASSASEPTVATSYGPRWVGGQVVTLNVRSGPGTNYSKIGGLTALTPVTVVDKSGDWAKIVFNGDYGWVAAEYLDIQLPTLASRSGGGSVDGIRLAEYASSDKFLGIPYKNGGASLSGFDCSGFVMYVYNQFGVSLPHQSKSQYSYGVAVDKANLAPGDIVFFTGTSGSGIGHVGIYIGNSNFVHARSTGRPLGINSLNEDNYVKRYVGARRILN